MAPTSQAPQYVEFYVSCNPPLLPNGVKEVVSVAREHLSDKLLEILYEPEVPWFKLITEKNDRHEVTEFLEEALIAIADEDAAPVDPDNDGDDQKNELGNLVDVDIVKENPRMVPWTTHEEENLLPFRSFDPFRYPSTDTMDSAPYKAIWRLAERCPARNVNELLKAAWEMSSGPIVPSSVQGMEECFGCEVLYNLEQTVLYLGSHHSTSIIEKAVQKLDDIVKIAYPDNLTSGNNRSVTAWVEHVQRETGMDGVYDDRSSNTSSSKSRAAGYEFW